jgi:MoxR-like ATPase
MLKINLTYPSPSEEKLIIRQAIQPEGVDKVSKVMTTKDISRMRELVRKVYLDEKIEQYIVNIISATRSPERYSQNGMLVYGSSPRGSINLALAAKAFAFLKGRSFVIPEDIRAMAVDVLQHRIGLSYEADAERITSKQIIERLVSVVDVP